MTARTQVATHLRRVPPLPQILRNLSRIDAPVFENVAADAWDFDLTEAVDAPEPEVSKQVQRRIDEAIAYRCRLIRGDGENGSPASAYDVGRLMKKVRKLSRER